VERRRLPSRSQLFLILRRNRRGPRAAGLFCCIMQFGLDDYFFTVAIVFRIRETIW
jgi:hypothetical protein